MCFEFVPDPHHVETALTGPRRAIEGIRSHSQLKTWIPRFYRQPGPLFASIKVKDEKLAMVLPRLKEIGRAHV